MAEYTNFFFIFSLCEVVHFQEGFLLNKRKTIQIMAVEGEMATKMTNVRYNGYYSLF